LPSNIMPFPCLHKLACITCKAQAQPSWRHLAPDTGPDTRHPTPDTRYRTTGKLMASAGSISD
jgi:hypothetical protein